LQLQNNSTLGVEVVSEAYSIHAIYFKLWLFNLSHDIFGKYINNYSRVKPEHIIKVKHYMHNGQIIYKTTYVGYYKTRFLALLRLAYLICNSLVVGKTTLLRQKSQQTANKLGKAYQYQFL